VKNYQCEVEIAASAAAVFKAITTETGRKGWWTTTCRAGTGIGSRATFRFGKTYNVMLMEELTPDRDSSRTDTVSDLRQAGRFPE